MAFKFGDTEFNINNPKLEEMLSKTRGVAESLGKRSAEGIELSKKKLEAIDAKNKLGKLYEKFGELQYKGFIGEEVDDAQLAGIAAEISAVKDRLDLLNDEVEELKAKFSSSVADMAQKTRDAFQKDADTDTADEVEVEVFEDASEQD